jgi:hypothetical protein
MKPRSEQMKMTPKNIDRHTERTIELIIKHFTPTDAQLGEIKRVLRMRAARLKSESEPATTQQKKKAKP